MKPQTYRTAIFAIPLAVAALMASTAMAQEGRPGRDGGGKVESNAGGKSAGGGDRGSMRRDGDGDRGDRGNRNGGDRADRGDRDRGDRADRGDRDRGDRVNRADRRDRYDGNRRRWSGGNGPNRNWRSGRRYSWGPGFAFYLSDGYYYGECSWLKRRYNQTGNRIWLRRFAMCRDAV
jgi:hypothetical protein